MRKLLCAVLLALFVGGLLGCGGSDKKADENNTGGAAPVTKEGN